MNTVADTLDPANTPASTGMSTGRLFGAYLAEVRSECLRYLRMPSFMLPLLIFPAMFYLLFGVIMAPSMGQGASTWFLASYSVFGVMSPGLFGFGVSLAIERDNGLLTLKRALPMPPAAYLLGKMIMAMLAAAVVVLILLVMAVTLGHVTVHANNVFGLLATGMLGVLPFCALGFWVGMLVKGQAAPAVLNVIYLPMAFLSGLWFPLSMMPTFLQKLAPIFPSYHLEQIALDAVGIKDVALWPHVAVLAGFAAVFLGLAVRGLRRHG